MSEEQASASTEQLVREFLRDNPSFLDDNPEILEALNLSHSSGSAISLVERQVSVMRDRNKAMRKRLDKILATAHENDLLFAKTKQLTLNLLEAETPEGLIKQLYGSLRDDFAVSFYRLILFGDAKDLPNTRAGSANLARAREQLGTLLDAQQSVCGALRKDEMTFLFVNEAPQIASVAVVPLYQPDLYGVLALGHKDKNHYKTGTGTLFLDYIAAILNRILPKQLG